MDQKYRTPDRTSGKTSLLSPGDQTDGEALAQTTKHKKRSQTASRTVESFGEWQNRLWFDTWYIEIGFLVISLACFVAIGIVLSVFNGRDAPTLPSGLTMNAIIAVMSAASKSALVLVIASSIGQLKWVWYRQSRRLDDVQLFEDASRGPFGSFQLLWRHRGVSFASIGATIIVLASLFEPFTQQVLTFNSEVVEADSNLAIAKQARLALIDINYNDFNRATQAGIWTSNFERQLSCPTGNCTWETFPSISMCSKCGVLESPPKLEFCTWDLTSLPNISATTENSPLLYSGEMTHGKTILCNITFFDEFPHQFSVNVYNDCINGTDQTANSSTDNCSLVIEYPYWSTFLTDFDDDNDYHLSPSIFPTNQSILGVKNPMMVMGKTEFYLNDDLTSLHINESTTEVCVLNYCLQDYTISMKNGRNIVNVSNTRYGETYYDVQGFLGQNTSMYPYYCWVPESETFVWNDTNQAQINASYGNMIMSDPEHFSFCNLGWFRGVSDIGKLLVGNLTYQPQYECRAGSSDCEYQELGSLPLQGESGKGAQQIMDNNLTYVMNNLANSLTQFLENSNSTPIYGKVQHRVTRVNVRWRWLVLPGLLVLSGGVFLFMTIINTKRTGAPIWKNSVLAFLFTGFEDDQLKETRTGHSSAMHKRAKDMLLGLKTGDKDARIVFGRGGETRELRPMPYQSASASTTSSQIYGPVQPKSFLHDG